MLLGNYHQVQASYASSSQNVLMLRIELSAARAVLSLIENAASQAQANKAAVEAKVEYMMMELKEANTRVLNLLVDATAAYDAAFPMETANNPIAVEERLRALPTRLQAVMFEAICQEAPMVLAATLFHFGVVVNVREVEQGFPPEAEYTEIIDLVEELEDAANAILPEVNVERILHGHLNHP